MVRWAHLENVKIYYLPSSVHRSEENRCTVSDPPFESQSCHQKHLVKKKKFFFFNADIHFLHDCTRCHCE